ncbi:uncharacterized protein LOC131531396 isoform X2 [Onychostoma macrolepis]|uniref:uncharacterized protein LOC131531396 isoform X2 n=1 Tax=Onychostoma macrolepis TaxID=369639 RepID=UPI00272AE613|nr:uncharacterized protein LOC131531396 isoform X2 [Onychostoma macrolepis]
MADFGKHLTSLLRRREMKTVCLVLLFVSSVFGDTGEEVSVKEGTNVTLPTDVKQPNETMRWYFNNTLIALINGEPSTSCLYVGEGGIFRDRLKVDYKTGSLNITNITTNHTGCYEAELIRGNSTGKSVPLNRPSKCDSTKIYNKSSNSGDTIRTFNVHVNGSGLSPGVVAGIVVVVLLVVGGGVVVDVVVVVLLVAAAAAVVVGGVMIYRRRSFRNDGVEEKKMFR